MNLTVEWVKYDRELQPAPFLGDMPGIPIIRVATLRAWLLAEHEEASDVGKREAAAFISYLLAQLPEEQMNTYRIIVSGCDDDTIIVKQLSEEQAGFLKTIADDITTASLNGCMPKMKVDQILTKGAEER